MNKTEQKAKEWLIEQGYKDNEIIFSENTPDFTCMDGKRYEVKFLYGNQIIFYPTQLEKMENEDIILVFDRDKFIMQFKWKDRKKVPIKVKEIKLTDTSIKIEIDKEVANKIKEIKLKKLESYNEILKRVFQERKKENENNKR